MSDLTETLADSQKEMLQLIAPAIRKTSIVQNLENHDSESESFLSRTTSTTIKSKTTTSKTTPVNSRNMVTGVLNDSTNQPTKLPKQLHSRSEQVQNRPTILRLCGLFA